MENVWHASDSWEVNIERLTTNLRVWNKECFGNIFRRKKRILARLGGILRKLLERENDRLLNLRNTVWNEYNLILSQEKAYWFQHSRSHWIKLGDRNTRFFHQAFLIKRCVNRINALLNDKNEQVYNEEAIRDLLDSFFKIYILLLVFRINCL